MLQDDNGFSLQLHSTMNPSLLPHILHLKWCKWDDQKYNSTIVFLIIPSAASSVKSTLCAYQWCRRKIRHYKSVNINREACKVKHISAWTVKMSHSQKMQNFSYNLDRSRITWDEKKEITSMKWLVFVSELTSWEVFFNL